ncbi:MAG: FHA domain-containing protein [Planctomycetota bacterium]
MSVELKITRGSKNGTAAPIHPGYYLVGRHKDCQIRPKSRSVSRRHCLLLRNDDGFGALDLKSTRGTYVNGERIEPHRWRVLHDGDEIHFGKVAFTVAINEPAMAAAASELDSGEMSAAPQDPAFAGVPPTPDSFKSFDVAQFLEAEDAAEFEREYGIEPTEEIDDDTHIGRRSSEPPLHDTPSEIQADPAFEEDAAEEIDVNPTPNKKPPRRSIDHSQYKRKAKRSISLPTFEMPDWKMMGAIALVVGVLGLLGWQVYRFNQGQTVEVRQVPD